MHQISSFRNNVEIKNQKIQIEVIYGAFDKPARSLTLNCQSSNAFYGCVFCTQILQTNSKKKHYYELLSKYKYKTHLYATYCGINATKENKVFKGYKGHSPMQ